MSLEAERVICCHGCGAAVIAKRHDKSPNLKGVSPYYRAECGNCGFSVDYDLPEDFKQGLQETAS